MAQHRQQIKASQPIQLLPRIEGGIDGPVPSPLSSLHIDIASCRLCPSLSPWRQFGLDVYGTVRTGYVLVGEAPGYKSWEKRRRFTGPAGMLIRRALWQLADPHYRDLEDLFYITDVVKCHPASGPNSTANRSPTHAESDTCVGHLIREIDLLHPSVILTFGKTAAEAVGRVHSEARHMAFPHPSPRNQLTIRKHYATMKAFEDAIADTCRDLIVRLKQRLHHA